MTKEEQVAEHWRPRLKSNSIVGLFAGSLAFLPRQARYSSSNSYSSFGIYWSSTPRILRFFVWLAVKLDCRSGRLLTGAGSHRPEWRRTRGNKRAPEHRGLCCTYGVKLSDLQERMGASLLLLRRFPGLTIQTGIVMVKKQGIWERESRSATDPVQEATRKVV